MGAKEITLITGPCAVETYEQTMELAYKVGLVKGAVEPFKIRVGFRGGAWKPRTQYHNANGERVFEGRREEGLAWLGKAAKIHGLFIVTECMSEQDLRHFGRYLDEERDYIQTGARSSQNFALLYALGGTRFGVLLKNPQHGVDIDEAVGSLQRLERNRKKVYCMRGQKRFIDPDGIKNNFSDEILSRETQHKDARNLNNIEAIDVLREHPYFRENEILFCYDPSHTWGGKTDLMRRKIGEYAIKAITEYGYDMVIVEVHDKSDSALVDGDQALLTTTRNADWSKTNAGKEPEAGEFPITLVDIAGALIDFQAVRMGRGPEDGRVISAKEKLAGIRWDMAWG